MAGDDDLFDLRAKLAQEKKIVAAQAAELVAKEAELAALRARLPSEGVPPT